MVEEVHAHPGEITIFSGGSLTNIALAIRLEPKFASLCKSLVLMGGYIDVMLLRLGGTRLLMDLNSDVSACGFMMTDKL